MELESPADAWYVWFGVGLISFAFMGVVASFPSQPPPDAPAAADVVDEAAASGYNATGEHDHAADEWYVTGATIVMRNDGGTSRADFAFAEPVPVWADSSGRLEDVLYGDDPSEHFADPDAFESAIDGAETRLEDSLTSDDPPKWRVADGTLVVKYVVWGDKRATLVDA